MKMSFLKFLGYFSVVILISSCSNDTEFHKKLKTEFIEKYSKVENELGEVNFQIDTVETLELNGNSIYSLIIIGKSNPVWSISEKVVVSDMTGKILFESTFRQIGKENKVECTVDRVSISGMEKLENENLLFVDWKSHYNPCCGHHSETEIERIVFDTESLNKLTSFELFYENLQNGKCVDIEKAVRRETSVIVGQNKLVLKTERFTENELDKTTEKTVEL
jgi:hypothetical protein